MDKLFFVVSKVGWALIRPETWLVLALGWALLATGRRQRQVLGGALAAVLALGFLPLGDLVLRPLEPPAPRVPVAGPVAGIVVLGGAEAAALTRAHGQPALNGAGERLTMALALARRHPEAKVVYTGGSGALLDLRLAPTSAAEGVLRGAGLAPERLIVEGHSRNTWENATLSRALVQPAPDETWILVTSAFHMPRALGAFCAAGWRLVPWPADYRSGAFAARIRWDLAHHLHDLNTGVKEWVGRWVYRASGRWAPPEACQPPLSRK